MRLTDLDAHFLARLDDGCIDFGEAGERAQQGVMFLCPKCFAANGGARGTHSVICWFINPREGAPVPDDASPGPGRWTREGETINTLTLGPGRNGARSVLLTSGCGWHGFVTAGDAT